MLTSASTGRARVVQVRAIALLVASTLLAVGCSSNSGGAASDGATKVHMASGSLTALPTLPAQIAIAKGYFKDEGLDVTIDDVKAGSKALQALLAGQVEVTVGFYEHTIQSAVKGQQIRSFVDLTTMPGYALVVSPGSVGQVRTLTDLKGKSVGVSAPGSATDFFLKFLLSRAGVPADSVPAVGIGIGPSSVAAVERNQVAASVLYDPALTAVLTKHPGLTVLGDARDPAKAQQVFGADSYPSMTLYAKTTWLDQHADTARKLATAIRKADQYLHSASVDEITASLSKETVGPDVAQFKQVLAATIPYISTNGTIDAKGAEAVATVLGQTDPAIKAANLDPANYYTNDLLQAN